MGPELFKPEQPKSQVVDALHVGEASIRTELESFSGSRLVSQLLLLSCLALLVRLFTTASLWHPDLWWHLENARRFLATGHFATTDIYSFTAADAQWIDHEWLSELPFYASWHCFGWRGLYVFTLALQTLYAWGVFHLAYRASRNSNAAFLYSCLAVVLATVNFGPRTILLGWVYCIALLILLDSFRRGRTSSLWLVPILFALWINSHASWLIGFGLFALIVVCGFIPSPVWCEESWQWSRQQKRGLLLAGLTSFMALFANPYTYRLVLYPFQFAFRQETNVGTVLEWASVNFHDPRGKTVFLLLAIVVVTLAMSRIRPTLEELLLTVLALYAGLTHVRFLLLTAVLLAPVITRRLSFIPANRSTSEGKHLRGALAVVVFVIVVISVPSARTIEAASSEKSPDGAIAFLRQQGSDVRVFNYWEWGGSEIWAGGPRPFIDTRTDIFEYNGTLKAYLSAIQIERPLEVFDEYRIDYVLFPPNTRLAYLLQHNQNWKVVYRDDASLVFGRTSGAQSVQLPRN